MEVSFSLWCVHLVSYYTPFQSPDINNGVVKTRPQTHLEQFLAHYPLFQYDPSAPVLAQFQAMCHIYDFPWPGTGSWGVGSGLGLGVDATRAGFRLTVVQIFNDLFGMDMNDLKNWQSFCAVLEVSSVLTELRACQAVCCLHQIYIG